ncbi:peptide methionine sulfoxide reductase [Raphidocelis subcapitata]|uniref:peptidylprolyl isomerase n=1 Tax=Raphidocelis subcapitata TaxID=307507 RepID=A0A2V0PK41_9CHLO|nr:peptide methionine sulfoxide reductase [Raphidocelis subcapitata]|eukprot:GBF97405.1 peptide methionine sulfoxide reductase [Raphidocelis subcapitata]
MQLASRALARRALAAAPPRTPRRQACSVVAQSAKAVDGDFVAVHYTGTLDDGSVFDTSRKDGRTPLEFRIGAGNGFDMAVTGLSVGETRKLRLTPEQGYGEREDGAVISVPADRAPKGLSVGDRVQLSNGMPATVTEVDPVKGVTIDLNHELAGKHLTFDVELMALTPAARLSTVVFGAGCFWGPQLLFDRVPGVLSTEVGYSQGSVANPSYEQVCEGTTGHTEVVKVVYDPAELPFETLLDTFWAKHDPTSKDRQGGDSGTQYRAGIYTTTEEQAEVAKKYLEAKKSAMPGVKIWTELEPMREYYAAEDYHQNYLSRGGRNGNPQSNAKGCNDPIRCYG